MTHQLRTVLNLRDDDELTRTLRWFRDVLGMREQAAFSGPDGARVVILDAGRATLELANPAQSRFIDEVETDGVTSTPVRLAIEVDDAAAATAALAAAGATVLAEPVRTPWESLNARLVATDDTQLTLFTELADVERAGYVGTTIDAVGGEAGLLTLAVRLAAANGAAGQEPFAALVVRDGVVLGTGVNAQATQADPTAHAEVAAIRDAARRTGTSGLTGAVIVSSCEPCPMCRVTAWAAGVGEVVFAAPASAVPDALAGDRVTAARLAGAIADAVPGLVRQGDSDAVAAAAVFDPWR